MHHDTSNNYPSAVVDTAQKLHTAITPSMSDMTPGPHDTFLWFFSQYEELWSSPERWTTTARETSSYLRHLSDIAEHIGIILFRDALVCVGVVASISFADVPPRAHESHPRIE